MFDDKSEIDIYEGHSKIVKSYVLRLTSKVVGLMWAAWKKEIINTNLLFKRDKTLQESQLQAQARSSFLNQLNLKIPCKSPIDPFRFSLTQSLHARNNYKNLFHSWNLHDCLILPDLYTIFWSIQKIFRGFKFGKIWIYPTLLINSDYNHIWWTHLDQISDIIFKYSLNFLMTVFAEITISTKPIKNLKNPWNAQKPY